MEKILVLLDDDSVGNILNEKILSKHYSGHKMVVFSDPESALEYFSALDNKDLSSNDFTMFLDLNMPSMTGFEFLKGLEYIQDLMDDVNDLINLKVYILTFENSVFAKEKLKVFPMIQGFILKPLKAESVPLLVDS
jgi:CheY-like chemotaxis protein